MPSGHGGGAGGATTADEDTEATEAEGAVDTGCLPFKAVNVTMLAAASATAPTTMAAIFFPPPPELATAGTGVCIGGTLADDCMPLGGVWTFGPLDAGEGWLLLDEGMASVEAFVRSPVTEMAVCRRGVMWSAS